MEEENRHISVIMGAGDKRHDFITNLLLQSIKFFLIDRLDKQDLWQSE